MNDRLKNFVIGLVTLAWVVNVSAPIWVEQYKPSAEVNAVFMAVVGVYFGTRRSNDKGDDK